MTYQYTLLNALKTKYDNEPFDIVGIPTNQFGLQEPAMNAEILDGIRCVRPGQGYVPNFNLTTKEEVNGAEELQLYTFLKGQCGGTGSTIAVTSGIYWSPVSRDDITWNFEKFIIDKDGKPHSRYPPFIEPGQLEPVIESLMTAKSGVSGAKARVRKNPLRPRMAPHVQHHNKA